MQVIDSLYELNEPGTPPSSRGHQPWSKSEFFHWLTFEMYESRAKPAVPGRPRGRPILISTYPSNQFGRAVKHAVVVHPLHETPVDSGTTSIGTLLTESEKSNLSFKLKDVKDNFLKFLKPSGVSCGVHYVLIGRLILHYGIPNARENGDWVQDCSIYGKAMKHKLAEDLVISDIFRDEAACLQCFKNVWKYLKLDAWGKALCSGGSGSPTKAMKLVLTNLNLAWIKEQMLAIGTPLDGTQPVSPNVLLLGGPQRIVDQIDALVENDFHLASKMALTDGVITANYFKMLYYHKVHWWKNKLAILEFSEENPSSNVPSQLVNANVRLFKELKFPHNAHWE